MKILYTGGGTLGSVSPLLAIHQNLVSKSSVSDYRSLWIGTKKGPERKIIEDKMIKFQSIAAGKLRRYFDLRNIIDVFKIKLGFFQALFIILKFKPEVILSAGGFVAVPVIWAGWLLGVPSIIHQQDVRPGLANKLCAPFATRITVALDISLNNFSPRKTLLVGNPVRQDIKHSQQKIKIELLNKIGLNGRWPLLLVVGGGTGALAINQLIWQSLDELTKFCQIIHITGKNKNNQPALADNQPNYKSFEFLKSEILNIIQISDVVVSRAGMNFLTELAFYKKPTIIIPLPNSHQEDNAEYFAKKKAGIYLKQKELDNQKLIQQIKKLIDNEKQKKELAKNIHKIFVDYSGEKIIEQIKFIVNNTWSTNQRIINKTLKSESA